jgi:hypothetical protein
MAVRAEQPEVRALVAAALDQRQAMIDRALAARDSCAALLAAITRLGPHPCSETTKGVRALTPGVLTTAATSHRCSTAAGGTAERQRSHRRAQRCARLRIDALILALRFERERATVRPVLALTIAHGLRPLRLRTVYGISDDSCDDDCARACACREH